MNKCSGCQKNFRSVSAFDMHRTGNYGDTIYNDKGKSTGPGPSQRRCLTAEEMLALEMQQDEKGTWRGPANPFFATKEEDEPVEANP